jgi:hypothetical protein
MTSLRFRSAFFPLDLLLPATGGDRDMWQLSWPEPNEQVARSWVTRGSEALLAEARRRYIPTIWLTKPPSFFPCATAPLDFCP